MSIMVKRVYEPPLRSDGKRILVDRVWPRGLSKESAHLDDWMREIAPSDSLRKWFNHRADRWTEFQKRYQEELKDPSRAEMVDRIRKLGRRHVVTLVYGARDAEHNQAVALLNYLKK